MKTLMMKLKVLAAVVAGVVALGANAVTTNRTEEVIRPGFTLVKYVCDDTPCWRAYLMKVDLDTPGLRFDIGYPNGDEIGTTATVSTHASALKSKLEGEFGTGKVLFQTGINCDFFGGDGYTQRLDIRNGGQVQTGYDPNVPGFGAGNLRIYETTDGKFHMSEALFSGSVSVGGADYTIGYVNTLHHNASGVAVFTDGYLGTMPADGVEIEFDEAFAGGGGITLAGKSFKVVGPISSGAKFSGRSAKRGALVGLSSGEQSTIAALAANTTGTLSWGLTGVEGTADVRNLAGVWLWVLRDGEYVLNNDQHEDFATYTKGYPRTCMGLSAKNNQAVFFVNDGRQAGWSMHMSTAQVAALLKAEGCENGGQFDGGGSTTLWDSKNGVENSPCGGENPGTGKTYAVGEEREVAQTMFFSVIDTGDTPPTPPPPAGREDVLYIGPGATGSGTGWGDLAPISAINAADGTKEVWLKAGEYTIDAGLVSSVALTIRGGFAGMESAADERVAGARTVLDGQSADIGCETMMTITAASGTVTLDGVKFQNTWFRALKVSGGADIVIANCAFDGCGLYNVSGHDNLEGRGAWLSGSATATLTVSNVEFQNNLIRNPANWGENMSGCAAYVTSFARATFTDCLFYRNGLDFNNSSRPMTGRDRTSGYVLSLINVPTTATRCRFLGNGAMVNSNGGNPDGQIVYLYGNSGGSSFDHCLWAGNLMITSNEAVENYGGNLGQHGAMVVNVNAGLKVDFDHCVFSYNAAAIPRSAAGLSVQSGDVRVTNSILWGNVDSSVNVGAADAYLGAGKLAISHSIVQGKSRDGGYVGASSTLLVDFGEGVIEGDPLFVTPIETFLGELRATGVGGAATYPATAKRVDFKSTCDPRVWDFHLRNSEGRWADGDWVTTDTVVSPGIDAGTGDYTLEPAPNGARANIGLYGNTAEAGLAGVGVPSAPQVSVRQVAEENLVYYDVTLGGEGVYKATVTVYNGTTDGGDDPTAWANKVVLTDAARNGSVFAVPAGEYYAKGATVYYRVEVETATEKAVATDSFIVTIDPPTAAGGGETVIHVKANATGKGDGSDWANAVTTLAAALPLIDAASGRTNIWISGDCVLTGELGISVPVTICGGFAGTESAADERAANARSVIDGNGVVGTLMSLSAASGTTLLDQLVLTNAKTRAIYKSGAGSLTVRNGEIKDILSGVSATGHAIEASGNTSTTRVTLEGVTVLNVRDNTQGNHPWSVEGTLFRFTSMKEVALRDTIVRECGCRKDLEGNCSGRENNPNLIYLSGVPIHATNVKFIGNRTGNHNDLKGGAMIFLTGNCSGSTFDHCLFVANCNVTFGDNQNNRGGVITSEMSASANTVSFESCTFAYNVSGTCPTAGINLNTGTANIHNCIFFGNVVSTKYGKAADLYLRNTNARANISYCSFTDYATTVKAAAGTLNPSVGTVLEGDPLFATSKETFLSDYLKSGTKAIPASAYNCTIDGSADFDALDLHLKSTVARWNGTAWVQDEQLSPMIDSGDPASDATNEPAPSKCIDIGFYGNTSEASAPSSIVPEIASVEFTQPTPASEYHASFTITMGGQSGYSATTTLCYGLTEHDGVDGWDHKVIYSGSECGSVHTETIAEFHPTGTPLKWRVYTENKNGSDIETGTFTYAGATPTITAGAVDQGYFYTRPLFTASLVNQSAAGEVSVSEVYFCYGVEQSAADGTNGWSTVRRVGTLKSPGDTIEMTPIRLVAKGTKYYYRWVVTDALGQNETAILSTTVTGSEPPGFVRGHAYGLNPSEESGEEVTVIHVWSEAKGLGDGSDWVNACTNLQDAAKLASGARTNLVLAGTVEVLQSGVANFTVPVQLLGGFTGYEDAMSDRDSSKRAVIEGRNVGKGIYLSATTGTTLIEDVEVKHMNGRGIEKANAGNLELRRCRIEDNGVNASQIGVGMYAAGNAGSSSLLCEDVDFVGNVLYNEGNYNGSGCGAYVTSFKKATFTNCDFIGNGVRTSGWSGGGGRDSTHGYALYLNGAPATLTGCRFIGNRYIQNHTGWGDGTAVSVEGNGDGTLFKNCLFLANQGQRYGNNSYSTSVYAGALGVRMDNASRKLALENCTFAYNVNSSGCTAGLDVYNGAVTVHNSIFWGNLLSDAATSANCGADIAVLGSGSCTVSHSIVSGKTTPFVKGVTFGENVETKDPLFVHGFDELAADFLTHDGTANFANAVGGTRMYYANSLDLDTLDVHLKSSTGWTDETTGQLNRTRKENGFWVFSPAIDAGDPKSDCSLEPAPAGKRVNLGCYGNTPWASMSKRKGFAVIIR